MKKICVYFLVFTFLFISFDSISVAASVLSSKRELEVFPNAFSRDSIVRPKAKVGTISIFDHSENKWVLGTALWSELPKIEERMRVRIEGIDDGKTEIYFEILDGKKYTVHTTPKQTVWGYKPYGDYREKINVFLNDKILQ